MGTTPFYRESTRYTATELGGHSVTRRNAGNMRLTTQSDSLTAAMIGFLQEMLSHHT